MAALPSNVSTGIVRISLRTVVLESSANPVPIEMPLTGSVTFTPSPSFFRHVGEGLIFPATPQTVYLDSNGDAEITLMATDDVDISPVNWTYEVSFNLYEATMDSFSINVPSNSDRELATLTPAPASAGQYWTEDQYATLQAQIEALGYGVPLGGVLLYLADTPPASATGINGEPIVWITGGSLLDPVPTVPLAPTFNLNARTVTTASVTGVQYVLVDGVNRVPLATGSTDLSGYGLPFVARVEAEATPGYTLLADYSWTAQFNTSAALTLVSSDGFGGTPSALVNNRAWDKALGGTSNVTWTDIYVTTNRLMIDSTGSGLTINEAQTERWGVQMFDTGAADSKLLVDISAFPPAHSRALKVHFSDNVTASIDTESQSATVTFGASAMSPSWTPVVRTYMASGLTQANLLGTWEFTWVNRYLQVTAPDNTVMGADYNGYTPSGWAWSNKSGISLSDYNMATPVQANYAHISGIRLYR